MEVVTIKFDYVYEDYLTLLLLEVEIHKGRFLSVTNVLSLFYSLFRFDSSYDVL